MANNETRQTLQAPSADAKIIKRSIAIAGHRTSVSLEEIFWRALKSMAEVRGSSTAALVAEIDAGRHGANLSSAIRVFVLQALLARQ
jgi:predicted DNA-binding ribbon-helix-helix protein